MMQLMRTQTNPIFPQKGLGGLMDDEQRRDRQSFYSNSNLNNVMKLERAGFLFFI